MYKKFQVQIHSGKYAYAFFSSGTSYYRLRNQSAGEKTTASTLTTVHIDNIIYIAKVNLLIDNFLTPCSVYNYAVYILFVKFNFFLINFTIIKLPSLSDDFDME